MLYDARLQHFRSYEDMSFEFGPGVNIIVGPNGSGKTNLLEALLVLSTGGSYRVSDADLVQFSHDWGRLDARVDDASDLRTVKIQLVPKLAKSYEIGGREFKRLTHNHSLPVVLFEPNHLQLLHGSPEGRRVYLDDILEQCQSGYGTFRRNYRRLLAQRNALLKHSHKPSKQELFPWNLRLSELGAVITRSRAELIETIAARMPELYADVSHTNDSVAVEYKTRFPLDRYETYMFEKLEQSRDDDIMRGFTAYGPHREDFVVTLNGKPVDEVASRGETRTIVLALKIIELETIEKARGRTPLLLLDDVFSELDGSRRRALTSYLQRYQTFLTTTDADVVVKHFTDSTIIPISTADNR